MRNSDLVKRISAEALVTALAAQAAVGMMFSETADALARGEKVTIRGFGTAVTSARAERIGRNPHTGERIPPRHWFRRGNREGCEDND